MKKTILIIICFSLFSCNDENNIEVNNKSLKKEIMSLISRINNNKPCKSDNIIVEFKKTKIYISNSIPVLTPDLVGVCELNKSKIYFYSKNNYYYNFIFIKFKKDNYKINKGYNSGCEPPMSSILLIGEKDKNKLTKWRLYPDGPDPADMQ